METKVVVIPGDRITDRDSFHTVFAEVLGFFAGYGRNMDAWIDIMGDLAAETPLSTVRTRPRQLLTLQVEGTDGLGERCPDLWRDFLACTAAVNRRRIVAGDMPLLALMPISRP